MVEAARCVELLRARQLAERRLTRLVAAVDGADVLLVVAAELDADELAEVLAVGPSFLTADDGVAVAGGKRGVLRRVDGEEPALDGQAGLAVEPVHATDGVLAVARGDHDVRRGRGLRFGFGGCRFGRFRGLSIVRRTRRCPGARGRAGAVADTLVGVDVCVRVATATTGYQHEG